MRKLIGAMLATGLACAVGCRSAGQVGMTPADRLAVARANWARGTSTSQVAETQTGQDPSQVTVAGAVSPTSSEATGKTDLARADATANKPTTLPPPSTSLIELTNPNRAPSVAVNPHGGPTSPSSDGTNTVYDHAVDYSWLEGELYFVQSRNSWRVRYAAPGAQDRYGGIVTLAGDWPTSVAHDGQVVRVEGTILNPDATEPQPAYWVRHFTVLKQAPVEGD